MDSNPPGFPTAMQQTAAFPVTTQSPQQFPYYPNAMPSFPQPKNTPPSHMTPQQQQLPHSFNAMPLQAGPGGAMMPSGFPQHSQAGPHANFTAPFAQPPVPTSMGQFIPPQATSAAAVPGTAAQSFSSNMASISANNMISAQQPRPTPQPNSVPNSSSAPQSPAAAAREKARVSILLEINSMLLQEVMNLQAAGKAGVPPTQQGSQESNPSPTSEQTPDKSAQRPSPEYVECMRRLQANLGYLATVADRAKKSGGVAPSAPAILTPPPNMPSMNEVYNRLSELFPRSAQGSIGTSQPSHQALQGNGRPSPSHATETVV
ncbi:uncharacterized protein BO97DRAFT_59621 [Aspergillus homomorphus CBS 101889]|uniref:Glutamine repeat protein-1 n=1 Tax=Aspergillus homomorphus (strain CBS 101889) TaxID=1450537 RepID=A0A395HXP9_ASPHC|nr:hypothetical protein BO97DRAFT_59621 [Aspergillus homomorphus CBS 101889]RAL12560.1 hypothetical protein BO97DRAFT_59621 [Aspergillus homomorphus CBS 101889]